MLAQVAFDKGAYFGGGFDDAEVAFTEDIGFEIEQSLHGIAPVIHVGSEAGMERTVDVLAKKHSFTVNINVN